MNWEQNIFLEKGTGKKRNDIKLQEKFLAPSVSICSADWLKKDQ